MDIGVQDIVGFKDQSSMQRSHAHPHMRLMSGVLMHQEIGYKYLCGNTHP